MKLLTYDPGSGPRAGVIVGDRIVDVAALLGESGLKDVQAVLELPDEPLARLQQSLGRASTAPSVPLAGTKLRSPILRPPTIRDFMIFEEHATQQGTREQHEAWYRMPVFYFSNTLRVYGPDEDVPYPVTSQQLDYELELGCVIGREGSDIREADAMNYIAGFLIFNDWSARDLQFDEMSVRLGPAKGKDCATSLGPWLVTTDEMAPYLRDGNLNVTCTLKVNGDYWLAEGRGGKGAQASHTWASMVERASRDSKIVPGDVLGSGTVGGGSIGEAIRKGYDKARFLKPGDVVEMDVQGIGTLRNRLAAKADPDPSYRYRSPLIPIPQLGVAKDYVWQPKK